MHARGTLLLGLCVAGLSFSCDRHRAASPSEAPPDVTSIPQRQTVFPRPAGDLGIVSSSGSDTLTLLDLAERRVLATVPVGIDPVDIDGPHHIVADRRSGSVFVALSYPAGGPTKGGHVHGSSTHPGFIQRLALDDLHVLGEVRTDPNPGDIALSDDRGRVVMTHYDLQLALAPGASLEARRAAVMAFDASGITEALPIDPVRIPTCVAPHGLVLSKPDGHVAYVACSGEDAIAIVDFDKPQEAPKLVPVGAGVNPSAPPIYGPFVVAASPVTDRIAVANTLSRDVRFFEVASQEMSSVVLPTRGAPYFLVWSGDGKHLFVPTQVPDAMLRVDVTTNAIEVTHPFDASECRSPHEAVLGTSGDALYVVCEGDRITPSNIVVLDPNDLTLKATIPVGVYPDRLVVLAP